MRGNMAHAQYYRHDRLEKGNITLTIENSKGGVIERKRGTVAEMRLYRFLHYPNAHNYRAHFDEFCNVSECPQCADVIPGKFVKS